jgi:peptidoglycan/xylan/chitin deacetylase (PgdA/CDA1 family)
MGELLRRLDAGETLPERTVVVTFDDGFADFAAAAWPALRARALPATLYVTAGTIGGCSRWLAPLGAGDTPMLDARQLRDLADEGCELGAHSMTHPQLDCLTLPAAAREITDSKDVLEQLLGQRVDSFAYPHGYHSRHVKDLVADAGYTSATAVRNALSHADDDRYAIARVTITADYDAARLERVLTGHGVPRAHGREKLRTAVWRQARRFRQPTTAGVS